MTPPGGVHPGEPGLCVAIGTGRDGQRGPGLCRGPDLNITDLADVLVRAGAVRAMELDINTDWVNFSA